MNSGTIESIACRYSLFEEGRKYSGNHRKYLIENAREVCYSPKVREQIKLREALGYYGHGIRQKAGRLRPQELNYAETAGGREVEIIAVPSNVTTQFDVAQDGTVTHTQDVLKTPSGEIVSSLHKSRVGGFSWACHGVDGGQHSPTELDDFAGFDYVLRPDFSYNRGYILEGAGDVDQLVLECVEAVVKDQAKAEAIVRSWKMDSDADMRGRRYRNAVYEAEAKMFSMQDRLDEMQRKLDKAAREASKLIAEGAKAREGYRTVLEGLQASLPFFIPEDAMQQMLEGDFSRARMVFEKAKTVDFRQYPLPQNDGRASALPPARNGGRHDDPDVGTAEFGFGMVL